MREKSGDLGQGGFPFAPAKISWAASMEEISAASGESRTTGPGKLGIGYVVGTIFLM